MRPRLGFELDIVHALDLSPAAIRGGLETVTASFTEVAGNDSVEADDLTQVLCAARGSPRRESRARDRRRSCTDGYRRRPRQVLAAREQVRVIVVCDKVTPRATAPPRSR